MVDPLRYTHHGRANSEERRHTVSATVDGETWDRIQAAKEERGWRPSDFIRDAVTEALDQIEAAPAESLTTG